MHGGALIHTNFPIWWQSCFHDNFSHDLNRKLNNSFVSVFEFGCSWIISWKVEFDSLINLLCHESRFSLSISSSKAHAHLKLAKSFCFNKFISSHQGNYNKFLIVKQQTISQKCKMRRAQLKLFIDSLLDKETQFFWYCSTVLVCQQFLIWYPLLCHKNCIRER